MDEMSEVDNRSLIVRLSPQVLVTRHGCTSLNNRLKKPRWMVNGWLINGQISGQINNADLEENLELMQRKHVLNGSTSWKE